MSYPFVDVFTEVSVLLLLSALIGAAALRLKQPLIVAFIATGVLVGPSALDWVRARDEVDLLARLGIALLLFLVGMKLDLRIIRTMGPVALSAGLGQVLFTSVFGFLIALGLGLETVPALYVAVALTFSSTIIIVKLLSDKREVDQLHGRIAIGFLIVQDIVVVLVMIGLTALGEAQNNIGLEALGVLLKGALFLVFIGLCIRYVLTPLLRRLAHSSELLMLFSIAWAVSMGALGVHLGLSKEVGAFVGGVALGSTPYREAVGARLVSLRDFLLIFFFIDLGAGLNLSTLADQVAPALVFSVFVLVGNPLIVMIILGYMGYRKRTSFKAGLTVAQISEFSLILAALGLRQGHIDNDTMGLITLVGLITISASTYLILYSDQIYHRLQPLLGVFERRITYRDQDDESGEAGGYDIVLFGLGSFGQMMARQFSQQGLTVLAIDADPSAESATEDLPFTVAYGDAESPEYVAHLPLGDARFVVSSIRDVPLNLALLVGLRDSDYKGETVVLVNDLADQDVLLDAGATRVIAPHRNAATAAVKEIL
ncbi:MAG: cation:proton antiporter, partial [Pseudomonadota bacterium]